MKIIITVLLLAALQGLAGASIIDTFKTSQIDRTSQIADAVNGH